MYVGIPNDKSDEMPNVHFGEIGDIWKHLPLAELLEGEEIEEYWETHSGSGIYSLDEWKSDPNYWRKSYGIEFFFQHRSKSELLTRCAYSKIINDYCVEEDNLVSSPGSPLLALHHSRKIRKFLFCDTDPVSLQSIQQTSQRFDSNSFTLDLYKVQTLFFLNIEGEGIKQVGERIPKKPKTFFFIDPYNIFHKGEDGKDSVDLFSSLCKESFKAALWYGFDSTEDRLNKRSEIQKRLGNTTCSTLWWGEIAFVGIDTLQVNSGVPGGCAMIVANCDAGLCSELAIELTRIYSSATFPDASSGAIEFHLFKGQR